MPAIFVRILKGILVAVAVYIILLLVALVLALLPIGETFAGFVRQFAVAIAVLCGLWYAVNGGWTWGPGRN